MGKVILNDQEIKQLEAILGEIQFKHAAPIMNILNQNFIQEETDPKPIGGGGGSPLPPKPNDQ